MSNRDAGPVTFLLVDDRDENLVSLDALLKRDDLVLLKARSGREALELLLKHEIGLVLLDVQMPDMDGFELAELMRGNERTRRVPIIFVTAGSSDRGRRFRGYEAGAVDFLNKPIEPDILRSKVGVFFELCRQRQQLASQRDALKDYADALKEADKRKDDFLAVLAHELRNPLTPIRNGLQIMRMFPERPAEDILGIMDRQITHLVRLIDDLLDVSRVSRGKIELRRQRVTLQIAIQAAMETITPLVDASRHTLTVDIPEEPIWLDADLTRLAQIMSNLLNNAAKYTPPGGRIEVSVAREEGNVAVSVTDNGVGIPPNMLRKIFDLFTQVESGVARAHGGLGIGLALARQLIEMHNGTIEARSPGPGLGSTFTIRLPLNEADAPPSVEELQPPGRGAALKVLVVDDNVSSAETTSLMLTMHGHTTKVAFDGPKALELARELEPDVIMLDLGLPGMSGYEVCRELRRDPLFKDTMVIAQTGWGQERDRQMTREAGFDHHLTKPLNFNELSVLLAGV